MDFATPIELRDRLEEIRGFARGELREAERVLDRMPDPAEAYRSDTYKAIRRRCADHGLNRLLLPKALGGPDLPPIAYYLIMEELAAGAPGLALVSVIDPLGAVLVAGRKHEVYESYVRSFLTDDTGKHSGAWAITEPNVGSDLLSTDGSFQTVAEPTADGYLINGSKSRWCGNGYLADIFAVMICVEPDQGMNGTGVFVIPGDWPGLVRSEPVQTVGLRALNQCSISFEDCAVPKEFLIIPPGPKYPLILQTGFLAPGNLSIGFAALGIAQAAYDLGLAYASDRRQGGRAIAEHQLVAKRLFDSYTHIEASRLMLRRAAQDTVDGRVDMTAIFAARVLACRTAVQVTQDMVYVHGANGIALDHGAEKLWRDAQPLLFADGPTDVVSLEGARRLVEAARAAPTPS